MTNTPLARGDREERPSPRTGITWEVRVRGQKLFLRTGEFADGRLCEVFLDVSNQGTLLQSTMRAFAVTLSLGLQHGTPLAEYVSGFRGSQSEPCGPVVGDPDIRSCTSLFDYIARRLELTYLRRAEVEIGPRVRYEDMTAEAVARMDAMAADGKDVDPPAPENTAGHISESVWG